MRNLFYHKEKPLSNIILMEVFIMQEIRNKNEIMDEIVSVLFALQYIDLKRVLVYAKSMKEGTANE